MFEQRKPYHRHRPPRHNDDSEIKQNTGSRGTVWMVRAPPLGCVEVEVCPVNLVSSLETKTWADGEH